MFYRCVFGIVYVLLLLDLVTSVVHADNDVHPSTEEVVECFQSIAGSMNMNWGPVISDVFAAAIADKLPLSFNALCADVPFIAAMAGVSMRSTDDDEGGANTTSVRRRLEDDACLDDVGTFCEATSQLFSGGSYYMNMVSELQDPYCAVCFSLLSGSEQDYTDADAVAHLIVDLEAADFLLAIAGSACEVAVACGDPYIGDCVAAGICAPAVQLAQALVDNIRILLDKADTHDHVLMSTHLTALFEDRLRIISNQKYLQNDLSGKFSTLTGSMSSQFTALSSNVDTQFADLTTFITDEFQTLTSRTLQTFEGLAITIDNEFSSLNSELGTQFTDLNTMVDTEFTALNTKVDSKFADLTTFIDVELETLTDYVGVKFGDLTTLINDEFAALNSKLDNKFDELTALNIKLFNLQNEWLNVKLNDVFFQLNTIDKLVRTQTGQRPGWNDQIGLDALFVEPTNVDVPQSSDDVAINSAHSMSMNRVQESSPIVSPPNKLWSVFNTQGLAESMKLLFFAFVGAVMMLMWRRCVMKQRQSNKVVAYDIVQQSSDIDEEQQVLQNMCSE